MKNKGVAFIVTMVMLITLLVTINMGLNFLDNITVRKCEVECFNGNVVIFNDAEGNLWGWELEKQEGYYLGQKVSLVMNTNNTKELKDDFILRIKVDKRKEKR